MSVTVGFIGTGSRGSYLLNTALNIPEATVIGVCDLHEDRRNAAAAAVRARFPEAPLCVTADAGVLLGLHPDCVIIATDWTTHIPLCVQAMEAGVMPGVECGGADSLDEVWQLVRTSERTGVPCRFLENCCFMRSEMTLTRMAKRGDFGEIVHCEGAYQHDLRQMIADCEENRQIRFRAYQYKNAEIYPSHAFGPIMQWLNIHHGNRILSLTSMASKARGLNAFTTEKRGRETHALQGDVVTTLLTCAHGETIRLTYDTTLPRPYSRGGRLQGTKGLWMEDNHSIYLEGRSPAHTWEDWNTYLADPNFEDPLWTEYGVEAVRTGGHGGCDYFCLRAFLNAVAGKESFPLDVYDAALIMAITPLSADSIAMGGRPVPVPDFTDGKWIKR